MDGFDRRPDPKSVPVIHESRHSLRVQWETAQLASMVALLIKAIQEQQAQIHDLRKQIRALKAIK
jgi:hypothetical protein